MSSLPCQQFPLERSLSHPPRRSFRVRDTSVTLRLSDDHLGGRFSPQHIFVAVHAVFRRRDDKKCPFVVHLSTECVQGPLSTCNPLAILIRHGSICSARAETRQDATVLWYHFRSSWCAAQTEPWAAQHTPPDLVRSLSTSGVFADPAAFHATLLSSKQDV